MEEHIFSYIKNENPNKLMKKVKKELHSVLPTENALLELEVLKKGTFLKKKLYLSVYTDHIIAFKVISFEFFAFWRDFYANSKGKGAKTAVIDNIPAVFFENRVAFATDKAERREKSQQIVRI